MSGLTFPPLRGNEPSRSASPWGHASAFVWLRDQEWCDSRSMNHSPTGKAEDRDLASRPSKRSSAVVHYRFVVHPFRKADPGMQNAPEAGALCVPCCCSVTSCCKVLVRTDQCPMSTARLNLFSRHHMTNSDTPDHKAKVFQVWHPRFRYIRPPDCSARVMRQPGRSSPACKHELAPPSRTLARNTPKCAATYLSKNFWK